MRPAGEIRQALLQAACELATANSGPTLTEMAHKACVALDAARRTVDNMKRGGVLRVPRHRRVDYRNRPVAEYEPVTSNPPQVDECVDVGSVFSLWAR